MVPQAPVKEEPSNAVELLCKIIQADVNQQLAMLVRGYRRNLLEEADKVNNLSSVTKRYTEKEVNQQIMTCFERTRQAIKDPRKDSRSSSGSRPSSASSSSRPRPASASTAASTINIKLAGGASKKPAAVPAKKAPPSRSRKSSSTASSSSSSSNQRNKATSEGGGSGACQTTTALSPGAAGDTHSGSSAQATDNTTATTSASKDSSQKSKRSRPKKVSSTSALNAGQQHEPSHVDAPNNVSDASHASSVDPADAKTEEHTHAHTSRPTTPKTTLGRSSRDASPPPCDSATIPEKGSPSNASPVEGKNLNSDELEDESDTEHAHSSKRTADAPLSSEHSPSSDANLPKRSRTSSLTPRAASDTGTTGKKISEKERRKRKESGKASLSDSVSSRDRGLASSRSMSLDSLDGNLRMPTPAEITISALLACHGEDEDSDGNDVFVPSARTTQPYPSDLNASACSDSSLERSGYSAASSKRQKSTADVKDDGNGEDHRIYPVDWDEFGSPVNDSTAVSATPTPETKSPATIEADAVESQSGAINATEGTAHDTDADADADVEDGFGDADNCVPVPVQRTYAVLKEDVVGALKKDSAGETSTGKEDSTVDNLGTNAPSNHTTQDDDSVQPTTAAQHGVTVQLSLPPTAAPSRYAEETLSDAVALMLVDHMHTHPSDDAHKEQNRKHNETNDADDMQDWDAEISSLMQGAPRQAAIRVPEDCTDPVMSTNEQVSTDNAGAVAAKEAEPDGTDAETEATGKSPPNTAAGAAAVNREAQEAPGAVDTISYSEQVRTNANTVHPGSAAHVSVENAADATGTQVEQDRVEDGCTDKPKAPGNPAVEDAAHITEAATVAATDAAEVKTSAEGEGSSAGAQSSSHGLSSGKSANGVKMQDAAEASLPKEHAEALDNSTPQQPSPQFDSMVWM